MMKYKIINKNGKEKIINAKNLDDAEKKALSIWKTYQDIILVDKTKGEEVGY